MSAASGVPIVDTHTHAFTADLPMLPGRRYTPPLSRPIEHLMAIADAHGVERIVLIQPSFLGTDNSYMLDCLRRHPDRLRGVAVVDPGTDGEALDELRAQGVVGLRLNVIDGMGPWRLDATLRALAGRAAERGMHVELYAAGETLADLLEFLHPTGVDLVVDHFGGVGASGTDDPGFRAVLAPRSGRRLWVKLSGPYRLGIADATPLARSLADALGPDRLVWGSDWPWTRNEAGRSYAALLAMLEDWLPDAAQREAVLTRNASDLFRFE